jgi:2,3-bisphosphoglycerate-independent phosphoglycerate mutase
LTIKIMKGILVVLDGLGDLPHYALHGKTPLEIAETPNLDFLAARGEIGFMYPVSPNHVPSSDESIVSIFGNDLSKNSRGQFEAKGADIKIEKGDLAFRVNFATIDNLDSGNIIDRRAGRTLTNKEAELLASSLNKIKLPCRFTFKSTIQHRAVLVFHGNFSDKISENDLAYSKKRQKDKIGNVVSLDNHENSQHTANVVNEFLEQAFEILDKHPVNVARRKKGLLPANYLLIRGAGKEIPKLKLYRKWFSVSYMPLEIGFSKISGMENFSFKYPPLKKLDVYDNLHKGLKKACRFSIKQIKKNRKKFDYAYVHIKETDLPGHDNKPFEKVKMIEYIDKTLFRFLRKFAPVNNVKVLVTGDHSTPCKLKNHSSDPVPVLLYNNSPPKEKRFCEKEMRKGSLGRIMGKDLLKSVGFLR